MVNADKVYVQSDNMREIYIKKLTEFAGDNTEDIWRKKICVKPEWMNDKKETTSHEGGKKRILFYTSISGIMQNQDEAVEKIERVLKTFKQYSEEIEVVWCVQELVDAVLPSLNRKLYECLKDIRNNYIIEKSDMYVMIKTRNHLVHVMHIMAIHHQLYRSTGMRGSQL